MERRANLARQALRMATPMPPIGWRRGIFGSGGADYADAEWVAGFIALTRRDDPAAAITHFTAFRAAVATPISLGRAGYWLGLAEEKAGDAAAAQAAFTAARPTRPASTASSRRRSWRRRRTRAGGGRHGAGLAERALHAVVGGAGGLLAASRRRRPAGVAVLRGRRREGQPEATRAALAQMAIDLGRPQIAIRIAKDAAAAGIVMPDQYYPLHLIARRAGRCRPSWRWRSRAGRASSTPRAASDAGARGLMQLMPATAKHMAGEVGVAYDPARLGNDPLYNARLGTAYLAQLLDRYDGSYVLATAAYNAGPGRVNQWIAAFGDPRAPGVDPVGWIEEIPFTETRNYVMRVLEALHVYRARLKGEPVPVQIVADINRTG